MVIIELNTCCRVQCAKSGSNNCSTEADFLKLPYLQFEGPQVRFHVIRNARIENVGESQSCMASELLQVLRWNDGTTEEINGTYLSEGTYRACPYATSQQQAQHSPVYDVCGINRPFSTMHD